MSENNLLDFALQCEDDAEILQKFLAAPLSAELQESLRVFLAEVKYPLAVRSSSLLEDSQYQPFTGVSSLHAGQPVSPILPCGWRS